MRVIKKLNYQLAISLLIVSLVGFLSVSVAIAQAEENQTETTNTENSVDDPSGGEGETTSVESSEDSVPSSAYDNRDNSGLQPRADNGVYNVDEFTGTFSYNYPLMIPHGRNGLQPDLSLNYNHRRQNIGSMFGFGWDFNIPSIVRENRTGIDNLYDENYFLLNGARLEPISVDSNGYGTYGKLIEEDFSKIEFNSANKWIVTDKLGTIYTYGASVSARQDNPNNSSQVYQWMLEEVRDTNDNYIKYEYYKDSGQIYPKKITYTGHGTTDGIFTINFEPFASGTPVANNYTSISYQAGFEVQTKYLINSIDVKIDGNLVSSYIFNLRSNNQGNKYLLYSITPEHYKDGQTFVKERVDFDYSDELPTYSLDENYTAPILGEDLGIGYNKRDMFIDINNDSYTDYIRIWCDDANDNIDIDISLNDGEGGWLGSSYSTDIAFSGVCDASLVNYSIPVSFAELNGDDMIDMVATIGTGTFYINNGNGWTTESKGLPVNLYQSNVSGTMDSVIFQDMNRDGYDDIIYNNNNLGNAQTSVIVYIRDIGQDTWTHDSDYDVLVNMGIHNCLVFGGSPFGYADLNSDGLLDLFYGYYCDIGSGSSGSGVYINTGNGFVSSTDYLAPANMSQVAYTGFTYQNVNYFSDIDQDGIFDGGAYTRSNWVYLGDEKSSGGLSLLGQQVFSTGEINSNQYFNNTMPVAIADINGDQIQDVIHSYQIGSNSYQEVYIGESGKVDILARINYQFGTTLNVYYDYSANERDVAGNLKNPDLPFDLYVVKEVVVDDDLDNWRGTKYEYSGGKTITYFDDNIKDLYGFTQVSKFEGKALADANGHYSIDNVASDTNLQKFTNYYHTAKDNGLHLHGRLMESDKLDYQDNILSKQFTTWQEQDLGNNRKFVYDYEVVSADLTGSSNKATAYRNDYNLGNGNLNTRHDLGEVNINTSNGTIISTVAGDEKDTDYGYAVNTTKHILAAPKNKIISDSLDSKQQDIYYNKQAYGLVDKVNPTKEDYIEDNVEINRSFNNYGLVYEQSDPKYATTTISYDSYNMYPESSTDPLNNTTNMEYNLLNGQVATTTDPNGKLVVNSYDAFGRLVSVKISDPDNPSSLITKQEITYHDETSVGQTDTGWVAPTSNSLYTNPNWIPLGNPQYAYVNDNNYAEAMAYSGQVIVQSYEGFDFNLPDNVAITGIEVFVKSKRSETENLETSLTWYSDSDSNWSSSILLDESLPGEIDVIGGQDNLWGLTPIVEDFDANNFSIKYIGYRYNGFGPTTWYLDYLAIKLYYQDANPGFNFSYKESKDYFDTNSYVTSREYYDGLDRVIQTKTQTATIGEYATVDISYDSQGRVERQSLPYITTSLDYTAPNLSQPAKTYTYDGLDRVLTETTPVGTTSYDYDGFKTTITDANGNIKELTKDAYGNLVEVKEHEGANTYTTNYDYSLTNKLAKITDSDGNIRNFHYDALDNLDFQDMVHIPSATSTPVISYTHDKNGNVLTETSFKGDNISYVYDNLNRVLYEKLNGVNKISYIYDLNDDIGQLSYVEYAEGNSRAYDYDILGHLRTSTTTIEGESFVMHFDYNLNGDIESITYPNGFVVTYGFNDLGQIDSVSLDKGAGAVVLVDNIDYNQNGQMTHLERVNGVDTDYTYDPQENFRLTDLETTKGIISLQDIHYDYDNVGNITQITDSSDNNLAKTVLYDYDELNRLASSTVSYIMHPQDNYSLIYDYDSIGNMTYNSDLGTLYYNNNNPHQLSSYASTTLAYDNAGNTLDNDATNFYWDWRNRLYYSLDIVSSDKSYYEYDHNNQRLLKYTDHLVWIEYHDPEEREREVNNEITANRLYMAESQPSGGYWSWRRIKEDKYVDGYFEQNKSNQNKTHIMLNGVKVATVNHTSEPYFILGDHLNSSSILVDSTGTVAELSDYLPFGKINYENITTNLSNDYTFTGQEYDEESDLQYYGARYMDNEVGRFTAIDPLLLDLNRSSIYDKLYKDNYSLDDNFKSLLKNLSVNKKKVTENDLKDTAYLYFLSDPQQLNSYAYVTNNPIIGVDLNGETEYHFSFTTNAGIGGEAGTTWTFGVATDGSYGISQTGHAGGLAGADASLGLSLGYSNAESWGQTEGNGYYTGLGGKLGIGLEGNVSWSDEGEYEGFDIGGSIGPSTPIYLHAGVEDTTVVAEGNIKNDLNNAWQSVKQTTRNIFNKINIFNND